MATEHAAPSGKIGPHPLYRKPRHHLENAKGEWRECHWEEAVWRKYGQDNSVAVPDLWARVLSYQVMLRNTNKGDAGWGEIDLLAVTANVLPTVIELKGENSKESPLRMLVEGFAYAIAVKKCWEVFGPQFTSRIGTMNLPSHGASPESTPSSALHLFDTGRAACKSAVFDQLVRFFINLLRLWQNGVSRSRSPQCTIKERINLDCQI